MKQLRNDFPFFSYNKNVIYLDSAASTQKPQPVIDAMSTFYQKSYAPVHRGIYKIAEEATEHYENARKKIATFINVQWDEIVFTKNATEGINFIAAAWASDQLKQGEVIVLTELEHHSNLLPWQELAFKKKIELRFIPVLSDGSIDYQKIPEIITPKTRLVAITASSNAIGTVVDVNRIIKAAHAVGAKILIDAAQLAPHQNIDVKKMACDFLVFSGHKMLGPTGIGILFISKKIQPEVKPYQFGGGMVDEVSFDRSRVKSAPYCYEAGTQPIVEAIGFAHAIDYLKRINFDELKIYESSLCRQLIDGLQQIPNIRVFGPIDQLKNEGHLVSFLHTKHHSHDVAAYLDKHGICVRSGHYCAQPLAKKLSIEHSVRVSFYCYNNSDEIEYLLSIIKKIA